MFGGGYEPLPGRLGGGGTYGQNAQQHSRMCADLAAVKRTAPLAVLQFFGTTVFDYYAMNGVGYEIETAPSITNPSTTWRVAFSKLWEDEFETKRPINIRHAHAVGCSPTALSARIYTVQLVDAATVTVRSYSSSASLQSASEFITLTVW